MELLDDSAEASAGQIKELEACLLCLGIVLGVALMRRVVPNLPTISDCWSVGEINKVYDSWQEFTIE